MEKHNNNEEPTFGSSNHIIHIGDSLTKYGRSIFDALAIIGDNCNVNKCIAKRLKIPLIGCRSHIFNLAVNAHIDVNKVTINKVNTLMSKLKDLNNHAKLLQLSPLDPVNQNTTRWSSTYSMLKRFFVLEPVLQQIESIAEFLPHASEIEELQTVMAQLDDLNTVTVALQSATMNIPESREIFDEVLSRYSSMDKYLAPDEDIIHSPIFDNAVVKVMKGREDELNNDEAVALIDFLIPPVSNEDEQSNTNNVLSSFTIMEYVAAKRQKLADGAYKVSKYIDLRFLLSTSNFVERLFSLAKITLTDHRTSMSNNTFDALLFLQKNRSYWSVPDVAKAMHCSDTSQNSM
jgi:hypothetical protein